MSSLATPNYPPPGAQDSRASRSFDLEEAPPLDPSLINPAETAPEPSNVQSPGEGSAFVFPPPVDTTKKSKGKVGSKLSSLGGSFRGGFGKVRGIFKKGPKGAPTAGASIEEDEDGDFGGSREYLDDKDPYAQISDTPPTAAPIQKQTGSKMAASLKNLFKKPQNADPAPYVPGDVIEIQQPRKKNYVTFGNFINLLLISFIICGIVMCACIGINSSLYYIGPAALGLGCFALVGKCFFTMFWEEDPLPDIIKAPFLKLDKYVGGVKDPYGLESGKAYQTRGFGYLGPMSVTVTTKSDVVHMQPMGYPDAQPKMEEEAPRNPNPYYDDYPAPSSEPPQYTAPSYPAARSTPQTPW